MGLVTFQYRGFVSELKLEVAEQNPSWLNAILSTPERVVIINSTTITSKSLENPVWLPRKFKKIKEFFEFCVCVWFPNHLTLPSRIFEQGRVERGFYDFHLLHSLFSQ